jgi:hypothetical protein
MYRTPIFEDPIVIISGILSLIVIITFFIIAFRLRIIMQSASFLKEYFVSKGTTEGIVKRKICPREDCRHENIYIEHEPTGCKVCHVAFPEESHEVK